MPELGSLGSVRGAHGNVRPYRETPSPKTKQKQPVPIYLSVIAAK